jgi:Coenzyme PQQ synthesis protein D (PqqD)
MRMPEVSLVKAPNLDADLFEDELILMNLDNRKVVVLNGSARVLWDALDAVRSEAELLSLLRAGMANADPGELQAGLSELLQTLTRYGFLSSREVRP